MDRWRCSFFQDISRVISNWYATRSSNNTTIYMDLGESSTSFRIRCLEFYFPRHSVASSSPAPLSHSFSLLALHSSFSFSPLTRLTLSLPSRGSLRRASARFYPAFRDWRHLSWMDRQSSFAPARTYLSAALVAAPLRQCLFAHSMGDYVASEFTHSRKVRASRRRTLAV